MAPRIGLTAVALLAALHGGLGAPRAAARGTATATAGTTATAAATGLAASFAPAFDGWQQLGATLSRDEQVVAISMDFSPDGSPAFAYGWNDGERGTRIPVMVWDGESWIEIYHRTSQFPQSYAEFDFKAANNNYYLGLKISNSFGSVLNGGREWRGSYAFHNQLFDYQIEEGSGDMILFWISERPTGGGYVGTGDELVVVRYEGSAWDGYPAGEEAFGEPVALDRQTNATPPGVSSLRIRKGAPATATSRADHNYVVAWVNAGRLGVATGSLGRGFARLTLPQEVASTVNLAVGGEHACIAYHPQGGQAAEGEVHVACAADYGRGEWARLGGAAILAAELVDGLAVELTIAAGRVFVAGRSSILPRELVVKWAPLHEQEPEWTAVNLVGDAPVSHFELGAAAGGDTVYAVVSEDFGRGMKVHELLNVSRH